MNNKNITPILVLRRKKIEDEEESLKQVGCMERNYLYSDTKMIFFVCSCFVLGTRFHAPKKNPGKKKAFRIFGGFMFSPLFEDSKR